MVVRPIAPTTPALTPERQPCNLYSITTNPAAIAALFRVVNQYVGNLPPVPASFPTTLPRWCETLAPHCGPHGGL
jgi:hypothetical protein